MKRFDMFKDESLKVALDESERESMKESLLAYMEKNPVREPVLNQSGRDDSQKRLTKLFAIIIICLIISIGVVMISKRTNPYRIIKAEILRK